MRGLEQISSTKGPRRSSPKVNGAFPLDVEPHACDSAAMTTLKSKEQIYQGRILNLARHEVELPNGAVTKLDIFEHPGASAVVPFDGTHVTLIRQYRYAAGGYLWEIPAGTLERGEDPLDCAKRELTEEAGLVAGRVTRLGRVLTVPSFCTEIIHLFLAEELEKAPTAHEQDEVIDDVRRVTFPEVFEMIALGEVCDGKSIAGLVHAARATGHLGVRG